MNIWFLTESLNRWFYLQEIDRIFNGYDFSLWKIGVRYNIWYSITKCSSSFKSAFFYKVTVLSVYNNYKFNM